MPTEYFVTPYGVIPQYSFDTTTKGELSRLDIDNGAIIIDHAKHHGDDSHIILKGDLSQGEKYLTIKNQSGTVLSKIDHTGKFIGNIDAPEVDALSTEVDAILDLATENATDVFNLETSVSNNTSQLSLVAAHETALSEATHQATADKIVQRDESGDVYHNTITTEILQVGNSAALYGDTNMQFVPQSIVNGSPVNKPGFTYRFGRNEEIGDLSGVGDGIEMKNLDTANAGSHPNELLLQVNGQTPTIEIKATKFLTVPVIRVRNKDDELSIDMSEQGYKTYRSLNYRQMLPNATTTINMSAGRSTYELSLTSALHASDSSIVELSMTKLPEASPTKDFISTEISAYNTAEDVYIDKTIRSQSGLIETLKLFVKSTGEIPQGSLIYLYVTVLECL